MESDKIRQAIEGLSERGFYKDAVGNDWVSVDREVLEKLKALIEPEKWEPKEYPENWNISSRGNVTNSSQSNKAFRLYGNESPTREVAGKIEGTNRRNQRIMQAKTEMGFGDGQYEICFGSVDSEKKDWQVVCVYRAANPELTFDTQEHGEEVLKMVGLNVH